MNQNQTDFYHELTRVIASPSDFNINPNLHFEQLNNMRVLCSKMETKLNLTLEKKLGEDIEIEIKKSLVTVGSAIKYILEMYAKLEQYETQLINQKIINLNLLVSNREKEMQIKNRDEKITELLNFKDHV